MSTMGDMEQPNASQPAPKDPRPMGADLVKHFDSLTVPNLFSVPLFIAWLRKPFQRRAKT
jgi:hypothetical protein